MRLGGPIHTHYDTPEAWAAGIELLGYSAAYCPVDERADEATVNAYARAAQDANIVIAEVGAWCNPLSPDEEARAAATIKCTAKLALAERIGARCCVNIAGSRGEKWDGPDARDLTDDTFDMIVEVVRGIIDAVRPTRTYYTLETMPWMYPDSVESYVALVEAIDRDAFAVHLDPVNLVNCPGRYFNNATLLRECFEKLGPHVRSCHAKDISLDTKLTVHLSEVRPGTGALDYAAFLSEAAKLDADLPIMLEHLSTPEEYDLAAGHIRRVAAEAGLSLDGTSD